MNEKKLLLGIVLAFIFLLSIGLTYAYFVITIDIEGEARQILTSTGTLELLYNGGETISAEEIYPGWSRTKSFTVTNTGSLSVFYSINWTNITNTITGDELVMSLTCTGEGCFSLSEEPVGNVDGPFASGISIEPGVTHTYELSLSFIEISLAQNYNQGKEFNGKITIEESVELFDMHGTLVDESDSPIVGAIMTLRSEPKVTITDENGNFTFEDVEVDNHTISATVEGEEILSDSFSIINGEKTKIFGSQITKREKAKQINIKIIAGNDKRISSMDEVFNTLSPSWATKLGITKNIIQAILVELTLDSPSTYTYDGTTYARSRNAVDISESNNGSVLASTYTDGTNEVIVMINSRGMTSLPENSTSLFSDTISSNSFTKLEYIQTENISTSQTIYMNKLFSNAGRNATLFSMNVSNWDTSKVIDMSYMYAATGYNATTWNIIGLNNWDTSKVVSMSSMFSSAGNKVTTFTMDLSNWDTSKVRTMNYMFDGAGGEATLFNVDLSNWDTSSVTNMASMFCMAGRKASSWSVGDISNWNTSNVQYMSYLFQLIGTNTTVLDLNIGNWDTSSVLDMSHMFESIGQKNTTFNLELSNWDTSSVLDMNYMFAGSGSHVSTFNLDLSNWDTSEVMNMSSMFDGAGQSASTVNLKLNNWDTSKVTNMSNMFNYFGAYASMTSLNIKGFDLSTSNTTLTDYEGMFYYMKSNAKITVGSFNSRSRILSLNNSYRPIAWTSSNFIVDSSISTNIDINSMYVYEIFDNNDFNSNILINSEETFPWIARNNRFESSNQNNHNTTSYSEISFTPINPSYLSFDFGVSSESNDKLTITLKGSDTSNRIIANAVGGPQIGTTSLALSSGVTYTLTLSYTKNSTNSSGSDTAYIDNLLIE